MFLLLKRHFDLGQREKARKAAMAEKNRLHLKQSQNFVNHWNCLANKNVLKRVNFQQAHGEEHRRFLADRHFEMRKKRIGGLFAELEYATLRVHLNKDANNEKTTRYPSHEHESKENPEKAE